MTRRPDSLDPALDALLDAERAGTRPSDAALDRVWAHVDRSMSASGSGGSSEKPSLRMSRTAGWGAAHAGFVIALAFGAGGATGAGMTVLLRKPTERIVYVDRPAAPAASALRETIATPAATAPAVPDAAASASTRAPVARAVPVPSGPSSLPAERAILDGARKALAQSDGARAIALTDEHARRFPHPQLREEREAIAIEAMVLEGRYDEARQRARQFRAATPDSLFLPAVEASLASIP